MQSLEPIDGILLEGVDFVGKTAVAAILTELLRSRGVAAEGRRCFLRRSPFIEYMEVVARRTDSAIERDYCYTAALMADLANPPATLPYLVQDRHWLTQVGRNRFFHEDADHLSTRFIEERHRPFTTNVLITCSLDAKRARCSSRGAVSPRDRQLAADPDLHQRYEDFVRSLLPAQEGWHVVDTTELSAEEAAEQILARSTVLPRDLRRRENGS